MSTDDWKSELKQRIRDIREKKEQEQKAKERNESFRNEARKQAEKAKEKARSKAEEPQPSTSESESAEKPSVSEKKREQPGPTEGDRERNAPPAAREARPEKKQPTEDPARQKPTPNSEEADDLFHVSEPAEKPQSSAEMQRERSEARIREELARVSGPAKRKDEEDTLFPLENDDEQPEETGKPQAKEAYEDLSEKRSRFVARDVPVDSEEPEAEKVPSGYFSDVPDEADDDLDDAMVHPSESLDEAMDEYIPSEEEEEEEALPRDAAAMAPDSMPRKPTVIDKTARHTATMRLGAAALDIGIVAAIELGIIWIAAMIVQTSPLEMLFNSIVPLAGLYLALHFIYYLPFTATTGQTPGKAIMKLRAVRNDGHTVGVPLAAARWVLATVGTLCLIGYFMMFFTPAGKGLQDLALGMKVRKDRAPSE